MIKYPLFFDVNASAKSGVEAPIDAKSENFPPIACSIPTQFMGPGTGYSPEDLLGLAVISCLIATFKVFAERAKFAYEEIAATGKITIDRNAQGIPEFQKIHMHFTLKGVQDQEKARALLAEAEKFCLVSNVIKCEKTFEFAFA